jgi:hypothetical protein
MARWSSAAVRQVWRERLRRFARSGLSVAQFCEQEQVSTAAFYQWRKKLVANGRVPRRAADGRSGRRPAGVRSSPAFVPVQLLPAAAPVEVQLTNGVRVHVPAGDAEALKQTLLVVGGFSAAADGQHTAEDWPC